MADQNAEAPTRSLSEQNVRPQSFAHVFFKTKRFDEMIKFYRQLLNAEVVAGDDHVSFLTYDEENHRLAITHMPDLQDPDPSASGLEHIAYTYADLGDLFANYQRVKDLGILPYWCINHGPTTSIYYRDPDGNQVETQVENFNTAEELADFLQTPAFAANPVGVQFDPDRLVARYLAGDSEDELKRQGAAPRAPGTDWDFFAGRGVAEDDLRALEFTRCDALVAGDLDTIDGLLADDLVHIHGTGLIDDKAGYMTGLRDKYVFHEVDRPSLKVRIYGNAAVMTGPLKQSFSVRGEEIRHVVEGVTTQNWIRSGGTWRQVSCHNSFVKAA